jgi:hypothetical protein
MEWERIRRRTHFERMQHVPHELRIHSREPCYEGTCGIIVVPAFG